MIGTLRASVEDPGPPPDPHAVLAVAEDPDGRVVVLTAERWGHILDGHPELAPYRAQLLAAVRTPTERRPGRVPHEVWAFLATDRPSRWLQVVLHYRGARGQIVTAFARRALPARP
jgi:hypothetical protein